MSYGLRVFQVNFRSIIDLRRLDLFINFLSKFPDLFNIIVVGESWIESGKLNLYKLPNYERTFACRNGFAGGLAVYVHNRLNFSVTDSLSSSFFYVALTLYLPLNGVSTKFKLHAYYRPPEDSNMNFFLDHLAKAIESDRFGMIAGDMNIDVLKPRSSGISSFRNRYMNILSGCNYTIGNDKVTRPESGTLLDHAIFNCRNDISVHNSTVQHLFSDHNVVISHIPFSISKYVNVTKSSTDYDKVNAKLSELFDEVSLPQSNDVNELYAYFLTSFKSAIAEFSSVRTVRVKSAHLNCLSQ